MVVMKLKNITFGTIVFIILLHCCIPATSQEVEDEHDFNYDIGSDIGPDHWGEIHKEWSICGKGKLQSPIDLSDKRVKISSQLGKFRSSYRPAAAIVENRGHDIMLKWEEDAGRICINGTDYNLKQIHWHFPSEHTINGHRYSLEMHMVHQSADMKIAVVGTLYTIGRPDPFLMAMEKYIKKIAKRHSAKVEAGIVDPRHYIKRGSRKYYRYLGSLTTPPCTEGVLWTIIKKVRTVSRKQVALLRDSVHDDSDGNARPLQKINDRLVSLYRPSEVQH